VQRQPPFSHAAVLAFTRRSTTSKRFRSVAFGSMFPTISPVTSFTEAVTVTREPGPLQSSSARVFAR
jgi:hypothetical protein